MQVAKKRSKTCILVKNLPANTNKDEIKALFIKHGQIARFLMPQHGITALVDFIEPFEAKKAFTKLAYSQFKNAPLYLEWAPENVFLKSAPKTESDKEIVEDQTAKQEKQEKISSQQEKQDRISNQQEISSPPETKASIDDKDDVISDTEEPENDTTLFVKNLNFKTTEDSLKKVSIDLICKGHWSA